MTTVSVAAVRVPVRSITGDLRAIKIVWQRELIRFFDDKLRMVTALIQPFAFLFILGTGLSALTSGATHGVNIRTFLYPGILGMSLLFTALFSAASIVWDREFGFLREMLVAPVRRSSIVIGKCFGGASVAALQGVVVIAVAGLVGVPYVPLMIIEVFALQLLLAFALTSLGLVIAVRIKQMQSFMAINQMIVMPLYFISGALFPVANLPAWLAVLNRIDPLTYAVDPIRHVVFAQLHISPAARHVLDPGVTWGNWVVPPILEAAIVLAIGVVLLGVAIVRFSRED
ncbi:MAG TPA: ABC transporter permease [Pseudonocardiaceae bacterium]|nr:ABC transporter permease [Pseudonocardiaceae bacterium]